MLQPPRLHETRAFGNMRRQHPRHDRGAGMAQAPPQAGTIDLNADLLTANGAAEQRFARLPCCGDNADRTSKFHTTARPDPRRMLRAIEHDDDVLGWLQRFTPHLAGVNHRRHRCEKWQVVRTKIGLPESAGIFLGNKGGAEPAFAEPWVAHDRREEWNVVGDPAYVESVERIAHRRDGSIARRCPGAELCNHRVVEHGNFTPGECT